LGIRLHVEGAVVRDRPVLIVSNHTSWLDIPVVSAVAPLSFVAKKEVGTWPFVRTLARLQRSVFVDRTRRSSVGATADEMTTRLAAGEALVLFAEGTSSDGNRLLPFKTSLFAAAKPARRSGDGPAGTAVVQTLTLAYTHVHGVPVGRADRAGIGWYGDMEMGGHAWNLLKSGPLDVRIVIGEPVPLDRFADRKQLAAHTEAEVRCNLVRLLRPQGRSSVARDRT
jgi:1-acyl-sn-glycerol-3-phosphate acyltransferase